MDVTFGLTKSFHVQPRILPTLQPFNPPYPSRSNGLGISTTPGRVLVPASTLLEEAEEAEDDRDEQQDEQHLEGDADEELRQLQNQTQQHDRDQEYDRYDDPS